MKKIKFHYFAVDKVGNPIALTDAFNKLQQLAIGDRVKECNYVKIALDHIEPVSMEAGTIWTMRFSRLREDNWPGVSTLVEASKDLELDDDTYLSEETYVLYDPNKNRMVVQYNHIGVRPGKIQEYLSHCINISEGGYRLLPVLTDDAMSKYEAKKIVTSVDVVVDGLTAQDAAYFNGSSLMSAIQSTLDSDGVRLKMTFSVDARVKTNQLKRSFVTDLVDRVLKRNGEEDKIIVQVKEEESDAVELLNLMESRKGVEYDADSVPRTTGRRYEPEHMFKLINQAYREWEKSQ